MAVIRYKVNGYWRNIYITLAGGEQIEATDFENDLQKPRLTCSQCGSTAIDHTEIQCQINRQSRMQK